MRERERRNGWNKFAFHSLCILQSFWLPFTSPLISQKQRQASFISKTPSWLNGSDPLRETQLDLCWFLCIFCKFGSWVFIGFVGTCWICDGVEIQGGFVPNCCCCYHLGILCRSHPGILSLSYSHFLSRVLICCYGHQNIPMATLSVWYVCMYVLFIAHLPGFICWRLYMCIDW